jgi:hypothetical protein
VEQAPVERPSQDERRGIIYDGLERRLDGFCRHGFALQARDHRGLPLCTHGPDPAPEGVDVRVEPAPPPGGTAADPTRVPCVGNGTDGYRVQLIYARASDRPDGYGSWLPSFQQWAAMVDDVFNASAAQTGGVRHIRYVHDATCVAVVDNVVLSPTADDNFDNMLRELRGKGYSRTDRKYLVWMDATRYCGIAQIYYDDRPTQDNYSNGHPLVPGEVGRVDKGCWGNTNALVEAHELTHLLGGVQTSAPNATLYNHCTDEYDRLCYNDGGATRGLSFRCPSSHENRLDCNKDDYFNTNPGPGSYLSNHWNVANSRFLTSSGTAQPPPPPPATTTTTRPPSTTTTTTPPSTTTTRPPATTTTTRPPATTTTTRPAASAPSAPQTVYATQATNGGPGVTVFWSPPSSSGGSAVTGYRVYRGLDPTAMSLLATTGGSARNYTDAATTSNVLYWYYVTAVNAAGESPPSNFTRMLAR